MASPEPSAGAPVDPLIRYVKTGVAGAVAANVTHVGLVPADVVKTRIQINPAKYVGTLGATRTIVAEEGVGALFL